MRKAVHNNKANDFIQIMKAIIWFTNMLQYILHIFKYKVVLKLYTVPISFFVNVFSRYETCFFLVLHVPQYHFLAHKKNQHIKHFRVFRHPWVRFNHLTAYSERSRHNLICARSLEISCQIALGPTIQRYIEICERKHVCFANIGTCAFFRVLQSSIYIIMTQ